MSWECHFKDTKSHVIVSYDSFVRLFHLLKLPSQHICGPSAGIYGLLMINGGMFHAEPLMGGCAGPA